MIVFSFLESHLSIIQFEKQNACKRASEVHYCCETKQLTTRLTEGHHLDYLGITSYRKEPVGWLHKNELIAMIVCWDANMSGWMRWWKVMVIFLKGHHVSEKENIMAGLLSCWSQKRNECLPTLMPSDANLFWIYVIAPWCNAL